MVKLSYSTLNATINCHQFWLNKMMGLPTEDFEYFHYGKGGHDIIQRHVSGREKDPLLLHSMPSEHFNFPIVETKDFDENTHFEVPIDNKYLLHGYNDGLNLATKTILEIKISTTPWTSSKIKESMQKKCYALGRPEMTRMLLVTARPDLSGLKKFEVALTQKDRDEALAWIKDGIKIIEDATFDGGACRNCYRCVYKNSCEKSRS